MSVPGEAGFRPLDWSRVLLGEDLSVLLLLEILLRTGVVFLWLLFLLRMTGRRGLAQLSPLELAIVIALGSAAGDPMLYTEVPVLLAMLVLTGVVALQRGVSWLMNRSRPFENFVDGVPLELVRDGVIVDGGLRRARMSREDLFERLRPEGVEQLGQVRRVYLEQSGELSVFLLPADLVRPGLPIAPPWDVEAPHAGGLFGAVACQECGRVREQRSVPCECGELAVYPATIDPWQVSESCG